MIRIDLSGEVYRVNVVVIKDLEFPNGRRGDRLVAKLGSETIATAWNMRRLNAKVLRLLASRQAR